MRSPNLVLWSPVESIRGLRLDRIIPSSHTRLSHLSVGNFPSRHGGSIRRSGDGVRRRRRRVTQRRSRRCTACLCNNVGSCRRRSQHREIGWLQGRLRNCVLVLRACRASSLLRITRSIARFPLLSSGRFPPVGFLAIIVEAASGAIACASHPICTERRLAVRDDIRSRRIVRNRIRREKR